MKSNATHPIINTPPTRHPEFRVISPPRYTFSEIVTGTVSLGSASGSGSGSGLGGSRTGSDEIAGTILSRGLPFFLLFRRDSSRSLANMAQFGFSSRDILFYSNLKKLREVTGPYVL